MSITYLFLKYHALSGPSTGDNSVLDYGSEATISGGIFVAAGSSQSAGSTLTLTDSDHQVLLSWEATKTFDSVILSCPELTVGDTYTLTAGSAECEVTLSSLIYSSVQQMGMGAGPGGPFR